MAQLLAGPAFAPPKPDTPSPEQIPPKSYSVIRIVGCFGFVWLFGAIEMRLTMLDEAIRRVAARLWWAARGIALASLWRPIPGQEPSMIDMIQEIDAFEPGLGLTLAPATLTPAAMFMWAGMFAAVYVATSSMIALMYRR